VRVKLKKAYSAEAAGLKILDFNLAAGVLALFEAFMADIEKLSGEILEKNQNTASKGKGLRPKL